MRSPLTWRFVPLFGIGVAVGYLCGWLAGSHFWRERAVEWRDVARLAVGDAWAMKERAQRAH